MSDLSVQQLKQSIDLLAIIQQDIDLKRVATTHGGEYAGQCPFCGGRDRFRVQPERGSWWCRQCSPDEHWQDVLDYVMRRDGVGFYEARLRLSNGGLASNFRITTPAPRPVPVQTMEWRAMANEIVAQCIVTLWADTPASRGALAWLKQRGLSEATLHAWQVGYNPTSRKLSGLWVDRGITLPYYLAGQLRAINVRRSDMFLKQNPAKAKYVMVQGSQRDFFGVDHLSHKPDLVIVEGEFDAMLVWQQANDLVDVLTMGAAGKVARELSLIYLVSAKRVFVATDNDQAGDAGAIKWLKLVGERGQRCVVPNGKDVTDFWKQGADLRCWLMQTLAGTPDALLPCRFTSETPQRLSGVPNPPRLASDSRRAYSGSTL